MMILRCIISIMLIFEMTCLNAQGTWSKIDVPTDHFLRAVHFTDSLYGWAAGNGGAIIHTEDGGQSWMVQESQTDNDIADIAFLNNNYGWAVAHNYTTSPFGTIILKTNDGGQTWTPDFYPEEDIFINCILFRDSLNIWMGGSPHALVKSEDGGATWQQATVDTTILAFFPVLSINFYDDNYGYACGGMFEIAGVIWRTWDGGDTWYAIDPDFAPADEVHELHLYDSITVIGSGGDPDFGYGVAFIRTWDGGLNWEYEEIGLPGNSYDLDFVTGSEAWAPLGQRQQMIYSIDSGDTWTPVETPGSTSIFDIMFPDILHGWAVGMDGAVLKYKPPLGVSADPLDMPEAESFYLQNYPNPFRSSTTIRFRIPGFQGSRVPEFQGSKIENCQSTSPNRPIAQSSNRPIVQPPNQRVKLDLFNPQGFLVATLLDEPLRPGVYEVRFDADGLAAGLYYCTLFMDGMGSATIKMILIP